jgi:protein KTI12
MPLVVLVGQPCSGKSGVAARLAALLDGQVLVVDEPSVHVQRDAAYASE